MRNVYFELFLLLLTPFVYDFVKPFHTPPAMVEPLQRADLILVEKANRKLTLYRNDLVVKSYKVALGAQPVGTKTRDGDGRTPEGDYFIDYKHPNSRFHLALRLSYPTPQEQAAAAANGTSAGSDMMIHGIRNGLGILSFLHRTVDWTDGSIAVTNGEIEEIWRYVGTGTKMKIVP